MFTFPVYHVHQTELADAAHFPNTSQASLDMPRAATLNSSTPPPAPGMEIITTGRTLIYHSLDIAVQNRLESAADITRSFNMLSVLMPFLTFQ